MICNSCGKTSLVSPEANLIGLLAAIFVGTAFIFLFIKRFGIGLTIIAAVPFMLLVKGQVTRILARLDPPDYM